MGFSGMSPWSLMLILGIAILLFGTKRLRTIGHDVGAAMKSFRKGMQEETSTDDDKPEDKA